MPGWRAGSRCQSQAISKNSCNSGSASGLGDPGPRPVFPRARPASSHGRSGSHLACWQGPSGHRGRHGPPFRGDACSLPGLRSGGGEGYRMAPDGVDCLERRQLVRKRPGSPRGVVVRYEPGRPADSGGPDWTGRAGCRGDSRAEVLRSSKGPTTGEIQ